MPDALGVSGWVFALGGLTVAVGTRLRLARHLEAVARACHEARAPLTSVRLGLELGSRTAAPGPDRVRAIELELCRAALALDDLDGLRAGGAGRRAPAECIAHVDLPQLLADSVEAARPMAVARGVRLQVEPSAPGIAVVGDRVRLAQAVGNLVANAIEHGGGIVTVTARSERGLVRVEVIDGGAGLPAPVDELARRRRCLRWRAPGAERGHGLAIASSIAAAHGGRLAAAPSHRGARLVLELPAVRDVSAAANPPARVAGLPRAAPPESVAQR